MQRTVWFLGLLAAAWGIGPLEARAGDEASLRVATFRCDVTPPLDGGFRGGWTQPLTSLVDPVWAKGVVLDDGTGRYVLCAVDWCELCNGTHALWQRRVAEAAGTDPSRVAVQCVHQHTAPIADGDAQALLDAQPGGVKCSDRKSLEQIADRLAAAVRQSLTHLEPFDRVGTSEAKVDRVAANRRVRLADGKIHVRWSASTDPELIRAPEGLVDPRVRTVTLARGEKPLVRLHYYATHPQTGLGDGPVSADFVGFARDRLEKAEGVFQIYFTGCAGNVTAGKYNDSSKAARDALTERLLAAMRASAQATRFAPASRLEWRVVPLEVQTREDAGFSRAENMALLSNAQADPKARVMAACRVAYHQRGGAALPLSALSIGPVRIVHLPGEPYVEFQLLAQRLASKQFVCVAGYGDGGPGYLCTEASYAEGGYEPTGSLLVPSSQTAIEKALERLLGTKR